MNEEKLNAELRGIRDILERIEQNLDRLMAKDTRQWIGMYFECVSKIPISFSPEEWEETEQMMYDSIVEMINGYFVARGTLRSGMHQELLKILEKEREKLLRGSKEAP